MYNADDYMVGDLTMNAVRAESARAIQKHGKHGTPLNPAMPRADKLVIMTDQIGQVAGAIVEFNLELLSEEELKAKLVRELLKLSATAAMFAQCEDS
jgi:hypothetical protein